MKKSTWSIVLVICLVLSLIQIQVQSDVARAAGAPKLSKNNIKFTDTGVFKTIKIKNVKKKQVKKLTVKSDNDNIVDFMVNSNKTSFKLVSGKSGVTWIHVTLKLKKKIKKKKTYKFDAKVTVSGGADEPEETPTATPSESPSASPSVSPTPTATAGPADKLSSEEQAIYNKIVAKKSTYPQDSDWSNSQKMTWYGVPDYVNATTIKGKIWNMKSGPSVLCAKLNDAAFGVTCDIGTKEIPLSQCPFDNPGRKVENPDPNTLRVGDIIRYDYPTGERVSLVIGKNSTQILIVDSNDNEKVNWNAFIPKTTKIQYALTRYQSAAPSPSPSASASPTPTPTATASATPTPSPVPGLTEEEQAKYERVCSFVSGHTEVQPGQPWSAQGTYVWWSVNPGVSEDKVGSEAYAAILSDFAFGISSKDECKNRARKVMTPPASSIRFGDIIRFNNDSHSAFVIGLEENYFVLAEGNYNNNGVINWGRKIPKTTVINYIWTRWPQ